MRGRWPSNFLLTHSPGCVKIGIKRVKGTGTAFEPQPKQMNRSIYGKTNTLGRECSYTDPDGLETIDDWRCVEGCVVRRLGEQSGILKSGAKNLVQNGWGDHGIYGQGKPHLKESIASKGTAARFYFQADWSYERIEDEELWQHGE